MIPGHPSAQSATMLASSVKLGGKATLSLKRQPNLGQRPGDILRQHLSLDECEGVGGPRNMRLAAVDHDRLAIVGELDGEPAGQWLDLERQATIHTADGALGINSAQGDWAVGTRAERVVAMLVARPARRGGYSTQRPSPRLGLLGHRGMAFARWICVKI